MGIKPSQFRFFLDSGAYSAWTKNTEIDLDEYCEFIKANIEHLDCYAALDCIPGGINRVATTQERNDAAKKSFKNYLYMVQEHGLDPIPVYHYGEDLSWLQNLLTYGCQYIGLGGLVGVATTPRRLWLDRVFTKLTDEAGKPVVKTHGFGMTALPLIFRYPWYSVDSMTWLMVGAVGNLYLPQTNKVGEFLFDRTPSIVCVSKNSPMAKQEGKHYNTMGPLSKKVVQAWLMYCNVTMEQVSGHYYYRDICNATFFKMVSEKRVASVFSDRITTQAGFF